MYCKKCGALLDDDARFCEKCGTPIVTNVNIENSTQEKEADVHSEETTEKIQQEDRAETVAGEALPEKPHHSHSRKVTILVSLIVLVAVIAVLFCIGGYEDASDHLYHDANFNNTGKFAYDNSCLYFYGAYTKDSEELSLYSTDYKGINKKMILENVEISRFRVIDGKIYYSTDDDKSCYYVIHTDGSENTKILELDDYSSDFDVCGTKLYYHAQDKIHVYDMENDEDTVLIDQADEFALGTSNLYYVADDVISAYNLKNADSTELCRADNISKLTTLDDQVYFVSDEGLNRTSAKENGEVSRLVSDSSMINYTFQGDQIWYVHEFNEDEIAALVSIMAEYDSSDEFWYKLALLNTGHIYCADGSGTPGTEISTNQVAAFALNCYPDGLYCKLSAWSNEFEQIVVSE